MRKEQDDGSEAGSVSINGKVEFRDVAMRYSPDLLPALKDLNFSVRPGEKVAVVGRTGAGKSSLYQVLLGFRNADTGDVSIDSQDISKAHL